jgi:hypothetical protein
LETLLGDFGAGGRRRGHDDDRFTKSHTLSVTA